VQCLDIAKCEIKACHHVLLALYSVWILQNVRQKYAIMCLLYAIMHCADIAKCEVKARHHVLFALCSVHILQNARQKGVIMCYLHSAVFRYCKLQREKHAIMCYLQSVVCGYGKMRLAINYVMYSTKNAQECTAPRIDNQ